MILVTFELVAHVPNHFTYIVIHEVRIPDNNRFSTNVNEALMISMAITTDIPLQYLNLKFSSPRASSSFGSISKTPDTWYGWPPYPYSRNKVHIIIKLLWTDEQIGKHASIYTERWIVTHLRHTLRHPNEIHPHQHVKRSDSTNTIDCND